MLICSSVALRLCYSTRLRQDKDDGTDNTPPLFYYVIIFINILLYRDLKFTIVILFRSDYLFSVLTS